MKLSVITNKKFGFKILGASYDIGVVELKLVERLSAPYRADLILACEETLTLEDVVGKEGLLTIAGDQADRQLHGMISRFAQTGRRGRFILYEAQLVPQMWLMSQKQDSRIFQNQGARDIITEILNDDQIPADRTAFRLQETYAAKDYSVQYQETDLAFLSRILESEGIWYFFEQEENKHVAVFADSRSAYKPIQEESRRFPLSNLKGWYRPTKSFINFLFPKP